MRTIRAQTVRVGDELMREDYTWTVTRVVHMAQTTIYCERMGADKTKWARIWVYPNGELVKVTADN